MLYTYFKREPIQKIISFREYFSKWLQSHGQPDKPAEEFKGPLPTYMNQMYNFSKIFAKFGFTPNKMTFFNFLLGFYAILFIDLGEISIFFAGFVIGVSGILDSIDGCIAGILEKETKFGAFFDATIDRFGDIVWMISPILYLLTSSDIYGNFYVNLFLSLALITIASTQIQEYCRARQQGLGLFSTPMTVGERPWRLLIMVGFLFDLGGSYFLQYIPAFTQGSLYSLHLAAVIWDIPILIMVLFVISVISIIQLSVHGRKNLDKIE